MIEQNLARLTYRNSGESVKRAWKIIVLAALFGSAVFVIVPLTTKIPVKKEENLIIVKAPEVVKIPLPEKEIIYEQKIEKSKEVLKEIATPQPPSLQVPEVTPIPLEISKAETDIKLNVDINLNTKIDFKVEKISTIANTVEKPNSTKNIPLTVSQNNIDYNGVFSATEVDSDATVIRRVEPDYPRNALRKNITGMVVVSCIINKEGDIVSPKIIKASPPDYFEESCMEVLSKMKYKPAMLNGKPVAQRLELTFDFGIKK